VNSSVVGLIPARGGSKGIPRKNIKPLAGKPLLAWTVEAALASRRLDRVVVSTDDAEIAAVARACGAEVPFMRPPELARDDTPGDAVVLHAIEWLCGNGATAPEYLMLLQPTCPLRETVDIDGAVDLARQRDAAAVVSVVEVSQHPCYARCIAADGRLTSFLDLLNRGGTPRAEPTRRQDLPEVYTENGAIFMARPSFFRQARTFFTPETHAYVMPPERSLDIDGEWSFLLAELIFRHRQEQRFKGAGGQGAGCGGPEFAATQGETPDPDAHVGAPAVPSAIHRPPSTAAPPEH